MGYFSANFFKTDFTNSSFFLKSRTLYNILPCSSDRKMPQAWINILVNRINDGENKWANFNCDRHYWKKLKEQARKSNRTFICDSDIPIAPPNPTNYPDIDSPRDEC